jgi:hypothetical protein
MKDRAKARGDGRLTHTRWGRGMSCPGRHGNRVDGGFRHSGGGWILNCKS